MRGDETIGRFMKEVLYGAEHGLFEDDAYKAMLYLWAHGLSDKRIKHLLHRRVQHHQFMRAINGNPFMQPRLTKGEIAFGFDQHRKELRVPVQNWNAHELCVAGSGSGKTYRSYLMALQILPHVRGAWLFDLRKREWWLLQPWFAYRGVDLTVVSGRQMKFNPLQVPESVSPEDWAARMGDLLVIVLTLPRRAGKLIQSTLIKQYQQMGVYDGSTNYPTLYHLYEDIKSQRKANAQARSAVLDNLEPVLLSLGPSVLAYHRGWTADDLSKLRIAFELGGLAEVDKNLILSWLVVSAFMSRIARGVSNRRMDLWINCDEAQRLCSASQGSTDQGGVIGDLIGLIRGTGIGLALSVQSFHDLLPSVVSNTAIKVLGRCGSHSDYRPVARSVGMSKEELRWATLNLRPGCFIGSVSEGGWRRPFVFELPYYDLRKAPPASSGREPAPDTPGLSHLPVTPATTPKRLT